MIEIIRWYCCYLSATRMGLPLYFIIISLLKSCFLSKGILILKNFTFEKFQLFWIIGSKIKNCRNSCRILLQKQKRRAKWRIKERQKDENFWSVMLNHCLYDPIKCFQLSFQIRLHCFTPKSQIGYWCDRHISRTNLLQLPSYHEHLLISLTLSLVSYLFADNGLLSAIVHVRSVLLTNEVSEIEVIPNSISFCIETHSYSQQSVWFSPTGFQ